eukprot:gene9906-biopygen13200
MVVSLVPLFPWGNERHDPGDSLIRSHADKEESAGTLRYASQGCAMRARSQLREHRDAAAEEVGRPQLQAREQRREQLEEPRLEPQVEVLHPVSEVGHPRPAHDDGGEVPPLKVPEVDESDGRVARVARHLRGRPPAMNEKGGSNEWKGGSKRGAKVCALRAPASRRGAAEEGRLLLLGEVREGGEDRVLAQRSTQREAGDAVAAPRVPVPLPAGARGDGALAHRHAGHLRAEGP